MDVEAPPHLLPDTASVAASHGDPPFRARLGAAVLVLWSAAAVACCISSIDVVLSLLGSSLSIVVSYLISCAEYLAVLEPRVESTRACVCSDEDCGNDHMNQLQPRDDLSQHPRCSKWLAGALIAAFVQLMLVSFVNAVYNSVVRPTWYGGRSEF
jgi:hypothetical protein